MRLPAALLPLRHPVYRSLWSAFVITSLGTWLQNTGAGWLMTSLAPSPLVVSMVQAATILPVFLLALPAGALADMVDRRRFLIATQIWTMGCAGLLATLTLAGMTGPWTLLALTFAIGIGAAMTGPAWGAIVPEVVPREDLVQAIALNGIGFNLARALGPALAGVLLLVAGASATFGLFALSILAVVAALLRWRPDSTRNNLPPEHLIGAMRAGMRFVRNTPAMRAAMVRVFAYSLPAAAPWALLPLVVRHQLGLDAGMFGLILGLMGVGGVASGMGLPALRRHIDRSGIVLVAGGMSAAGIFVLSLSSTWWQAAGGMALFGTGWVAAFSTVQAAAQLSAPPWVRARALAIYQLTFNGALTIGSFGWGWLASSYGLHATLVAAAATMLVLSLAARGFSLDQSAARATGTKPTRLPVPEAPDAALAPMLGHARARVLETVRYTVPADKRESFLVAMAEVRRARGRAGGLDWRLYEDIAHADCWLEQWWVESWADHLREADRLSEEDRGALARAAALQTAGTAPATARYLSVEPPHAGVNWPIGTRNVGERTALGGR